MTKSILLRGAALIVAAVSPVIVCAQFQQPNNEELKMTADPKAPGADAVYLEINEIANDPLHYKSTYTRIKVLTEKGKELATVELPYLKGILQSQRHQGPHHPSRWHYDSAHRQAGRPDGGEDRRTQIEKKVFTLPSVEVGSILEYSYDIRYDDNRFSSPEWEIQRTYFVHKAHYQFTPFKAFAPNGTPNKETSMYLVDSRGRADNSLIWWNRLPPGVKCRPA